MNTNKLINKEAIKTFTLRYYLEKINYSKVLQSILGTLIE
jgi:hypothetical protein